MAKVWLITEYANRIATWEQWNELSTEAHR
jgi:hypothetical protein